MKVFVNLFLYIIESAKISLRPLIAVLKYQDIKIYTGVNIGANCIFGKKIKIYKNAVVADTTIGDYSYIGGNSEIKNCKIGKFCSIAPQVKIGLGIHPVDKISTYPGFYSKSKSILVSFAIDVNIIEHKPVSIGNDVWIGVNSMIMDGVNIGNGAVIAAGSVVTKDVPAYAIVGGVPAKHIRYRFDEDKIRLLEQFKWWDLGLDFCKQNASIFQNPDAFFSYIENSVKENQV